MHSKIIIFLGPSLSLDRATAILPSGEFRGPIKRGDLDHIASDAVVGIIDGLFDQNLAISPGEIREAIYQGISIYGAASMGALRAAEIPRVNGVGRIFEMYRTGTIERDDEVAVLINPDTLEPLTEALVNIRFAVERLVRTGTINRSDGSEIINTSIRLHYTERTYKKILSESRLAANKDVNDLIRLLKTFNLKRDDAELLLETISTAKTTPETSASTSRISSFPRSTESHKRVSGREHSEAPILVWESGDLVQFSELVHFLKVTGRFENMARNAIGRLEVTKNLKLNPQSKPDDAYEGNFAQSLLDSARAHWGWESPEEAHLTMIDLGLGLDDVADSLHAEANIKKLIRAYGNTPSEQFLKALRIELWFNELSLKRETLRLGALRFFAKEGAELGPPTEEELQDAQRCIARLRGVFRWGTVVSTLTAIGVSSAELNETVQEIAFARRALRPIIEVMESTNSSGAPVARAESWKALEIGLVSSPKASLSARFSLNEVEASVLAEAIAKQMGIHRIGLVGELD
ncbi:MAG: TfuA-like protein, partial [Sphaerospermopsis kisseleviana]